MKILTDSREQLPFSFSKYDAEIEIRGLPVGDYSLPGFEDKIAIERKTINDLVGCLKNKERGRFERELAKAKHYEMFAVVCEATWRDLIQGNYRSEMKPESVCQSVLTFQVRYGTPFIWAGSRSEAEYITFSLLQKYTKELKERYDLSLKAA